MQDPTSTRTAFTRANGNPMRSKCRSMWLSATLAAAIIALAPPCLAETDSGSSDILRQTGNAFAAIAKKATPAVVFVQAERTMAVGVPVQPFGYNDPFGFFGDDPLRRFFHGQGRSVPRYEPRWFRQMGQGSGFIISKDGYILTNHHVVGDANKITVKLQDGREFDAERIGSDPQSEVAVIKINAHNLPCLALGDSTAMRVGEWVLAIGSPFGLSATVTTGIVSAKGRSGIGIADYESFIQTDAAINPGNSGGPLLNIEGRVIGINTAIYSKTGGNMGIGFAIPIDMAKAIKDQLVENGKVTRGFLGVVIQPVTSELAESFGLDGKTGILVSEVTADSAAGRAGIRQGDIILKLDGTPVRDVGAFRNQIASNPPGTEVKLAVFRDGREKDITVQTGALEDDTQTAVTPEISSEQSETLGASVQDLTDEVARELGYEPGEGVLVTHVEEGSLAWRVGIEPGDLITSVNRKSVPNVNAFMKAIRQAKKNGRVLLRVRDNVYSRFIVIPFD